MQEQASAASLEIFTLGLEQSQWRARAFQHSLIPSATDALLHMDRSALDIYMTTCAVESVERLEWLQTCYYSQGGNIRVSGTDIAFHDDISTMPACKYAALFDSRKCFDGLRFSFLSRICEPKWQNIDQCWPHDLDEAQTEQLVVFYTRHLMPLQKRGVPWEQPSDFFGMAWQAFRDALATRQTFFSAMMSCCCYVHCGRETSLSLVNVRMMDICNPSENCCTILPSLWWRCHQDTHKEQK